MLIFIPPTISRIFCEWCSFSVGRIVPSMEARPFNVSQLEFPAVLPGGSWSPQACRSRQVCVLQI